MLLHQVIKIGFLKKNIIYFSFSLALLCSNKISTFKVDGMMCFDGCVVKVYSIVKSIEGVKDSRVDFKKGLLTVSYDSLLVNENLIIENLSNKTTYKVKEYQEKTNKIFLDLLKIF